MGSEYKPQQFSRRKALAGSLAVGGTTWIAPSVLRLDRLAAAVGSCGVPPVRVDWTPLAGTFPTSVTANDGTVVTIASSDPFGVSDPTFQGMVWTNTLNSLDNPLLMAMEDAINGQGTTIRFEFSRPVRACFSLVDVDASNGNWIDTVEVTGTNAGSPVNLGAADMITGADNTFLSTNTVRGAVSYTHLTLPTTPYV